MGWAVSFPDMSVVWVGLGVDDGDGYDDAGRDEPANRGRLLCRHLILGLPILGCRQRVGYKRGPTDIFRD